MLNNFEGGGGLMCSQNCEFISHNYDFLNSQLQVYHAIMGKKSQNCEKKKQLPVLFSGGNGLPYKTNKDHFEILGEKYFWKQGHWTSALHSIFIHSICRISSYSGSCDI